MNSLMKDLVIDIRDITDEGHFITACHQPTTQDVEVDAASNMADVWLRLDRRTTEVDARFSLMDGSERGALAREGVVEMKCHGRYEFYCYF